jgi:hypothetical protein
MSKLAASFLFGTILIAAPVAAKNHCPPDTLGPNYPWLIKGIMPGDMYAEVFLDVDEEGRPTACAVGQNNVVRDQEYRACSVYLRGWRMDPPKPGTVVSAKVQQLFLIPKGRHLRAQRQARADYFARHPELDSSCYPKDY